VKKVLFASGLLAFLVACGGTAISDEGAPESANLGTMESALQVCGLGCPDSGQYVSFYACYNAGSCATVPNSCFGDYDMNATECYAVPATGDFAACGIDLHPTSNRYIAYFSAASTCEKTRNLSPPTNRTHYKVIPTYAFFACGSTCPSGFAAASYSYDSDCRRPTDDPDSTANNQVRCSPIGS